MRHDKIILGWTVLGLLALALVLGVGVDSGTHTTYINGSRIQSPSFNATGNISVGANSSTYLDNWGATFNRTNITRANISALNAPMNAAGFAINNPVLSNATLKDAMNLNSQNLLGLGLVNGTSGSIIRLIPTSCFYFQNSTGQYLLQICDAAADAVEMMKLSGSVSPQFNNTYNMGTTALAWKEIHGVTIIPGDINFGNGFKIVESSVSDESNGVPRLYFINDKNQTIMSLDGNGNVQFKGGITPNFVFTDKEYDKLNLHVNKTRQKATGYRVG